MIKAVITMGEKTLLVLGLSRMNTKKLHDGEPILMDMADIPDAAMEIIQNTERMNICIMAGETEDAVLQEIKNHFPIATGEN